MNNEYQKDEYYKYRRRLLTLQKVSSFYFEELMLQSFLAALMMLAFNCQNEEPDALEASFT